jgi:ribosome-binding protein aMBF1 (putative translation factor)
MSPVSAFSLVGGKGKPPNPPFSLFPQTPFFHRAKDRELARFFGKRLRDFRLDLRLSRYAVAYKTGFSEAAIRSYERGKRTPCYRFLVAFQQAFGIDINPFIPQAEDDFMGCEWWR